jgi:hypothetical protein
MENWMQLMLAKMLTRSVKYEIRKTRMNPKMVTDSVKYEVWKGRTEE